MTHVIYGYVLKTSNRNGSIIHTLKCHFLLCFMFGALDFFLQLTSSQCVRRIRDSSAIGPIAMTTFESVAAWQVVEERMWFYRVFFVWLPRYRVTVHFDRISRREYFDNYFIMLQMKCIIHCHKDLSAGRLWQHSC